MNEHQASKGQEGRDCGEAASQRPTGGCAGPLRGEARRAMGFGARKPFSFSRCVGSARKAAGLGPAFHVGRVHCAQIKKTTAA